MNKWQIICPVVTIAIVAIVMEITHLQSEHRRFLQMAAWSVGSDLIKTTNSPNLVKIGPHLQDKLSEILRFPTQVATVNFGDEPSPIGDGKASCRLVLTNQAAEGVVIRMRESDTAGQFHVLGYFTPDKEPALAK